MKGNSRWSWGHGMEEMKFYPTSSFIKDALKKFLRALIFLGTECCRSHAVRNRFRRLFKHAIRAWNYDAITSIIRANCQWRCFWEDLSFDANTNRVQLVKCKKHRHLCKMTRHRLCAVAIIYVSDASSWHAWTLFLVNKATKYRCPTYWISVFLGIQWPANMLFNFSLNKKNLSQLTRCNIAVPSSKVFG